jgi:hypothetical protein
VLRATSTRAHGSEPLGTVCRGHIMSPGKAVEAGPLASPRPPAPDRPNADASRPVVVRNDCTPNSDGSRRPPECPRATERRHSGFASRSPRVVRHVEVVAHARTSPQRQQRSTDGSAAEEDGIHGIRGPESRGTRSHNESSGTRRQPWRLKLQKVIAAQKGDVNDRPSTGCYNLRGRPTT